MASYFKKYATAKNETQKSDFQLRVNHSGDVRECNCLETHIQRLRAIILTTNLAAVVCVCKI